MVRGSRTPEIRPKFAPPVMFKLWKLRKFVWLKMLKTSARSCSRADSVKRMFFDIVKSTRCVGGPSTTPRGVLPNTFWNPNAAVSAVLAGFAWKQAVLNHCEAVCGAFSFGSQSKIGLAVGLALIIPLPAGSKLDVTTVKGKPLL